MGKTEYEHQCEDYTSQSFRSCLWDDRPDSLAVLRQCGLQHTEHVLLFCVFILLQAGKAWRSPLEAV